ncbi:hypothetical protein [Nocardia farcinica]|uniref:hypothetical protein n=1 Tax=Nocardia farcinica TaxID=37329 RepID=UPI0024582C76|nr:hypothetical protein [Nocardia farcinica]
MPPPFDLHKSARELAADLSTVLNKTICTGAKLTAVLDPGKKFAVLGNGVTKRNRIPRLGCPISRPTTCPTFLSAQMTLAPDEAGKHLMVDTSVIGLALDREMTKELLHYDYERDKGHGYPEAHLQICADSEHWHALGPDRALKKLHLPVGGRRFRPTLEDVIEFLIVEGFADGHPGWKAVLDASRDQFQEKQLRAAIRRYPEVAISQLRRDGHL